MNYQQEERRLLKFLVTSAAFFFIGTVHGVLQVQRPIRAWLDSIGSPLWGPGHMIDPLAHAHMNVIGGVVILLMAATFYLMPRISGQRLYSYKLVEHSFWWTSIGLICFYSTLLFFGIWEGQLMLTEGMEASEEAHRYYGRTISIASTIMGMGFWIFFFNVFMSYRIARKST